MNFSMKLLIQLALDQIPLGIVRVFRKRDC